MSKMTGRRQPPVVDKGSVVEVYAGAVAGSAVADGDKERDVNCRHVYERYRCGLSPDAAKAETQTAGT